MKRFFKWYAIAVGVLILVGVIVAAVGGSTEGSPERTLTTISTPEKPTVAATMAPRVTKNDVRTVFVAECTEHGALTREQCRCAFDLAFDGLTLQEMVDLSEREFEDSLIAGAIVCALQE